MYPRVEFLGALVFWTGKFHVIFGMSAMSSALNLGLGCWTFVCVGLRNQGFGASAFLVRLALSEAGINYWIPSLKKILRKTTKIS